MVRNDNDFRMPMLSPVQTVLVTDNPASNVVVKKKVLTPSTSEEAEDALRKKFQPSDNGSPSLPEHAVGSRDVLIACSPREEFYAKANARGVHLLQRDVNHLEPAIGDLKSLLTLVARDNQLEEFRMEICNLAALKSLNLGANQLRYLPEEIGKLNALENLYIDHNKLASLPTQIGNLTKLKSLWIYSNQLDRLPDEICSLAALEDLHIYGNRLKTLPDQIGKLAALKALDISRNQLEGLPDGIGALKNLESQKFLWSDNPLEKSIPSEVLRGGSDSLLAYLRLLNEGSPRLNRCKLLFVGRAGAGKTTLLRALKNQAFKTEVESTVGIDMSEWVYAPEKQEKITFTAWDFAGQRVYYSTHQLFLTARTVYLLCWSLRDAEEADFGLSFWLHSIQAKAPGSRVIIVGTRCHEYPFKTRVPKNLTTRLGKKFNNLTISFLAVDSKTEENISVLKDNIYEAAMKTNGVTARFPDVWITLLECAQRMRDDAHKIFPLPSFKQHLSSFSTPARAASGSASATATSRLKKALKYAEDDKAGLDIVVQVLHEMGVLFLSKDGNFVITDPKWLADVFKKVFNYSTDEVVHGSTGLKRTDSQHGRILLDGSITSQKLQECWKGLYLADDDDLNRLLILLFEAELAFPMGAKDYEALKSIRNKLASLKDAKDNKASKSIRDKAPLVAMTYMVPAISPLEPPSNSPLGPPSGSPLGPPSGSPSGTPSNSLLGPPAISPSNSIDTIKDPFKKGGIHRRFVFNFVPGGLLHRLTFKSSFNAVAVTSVWQRGVILKYNFEGKDVDVLMELGDSSLHLAIVTDLKFPVNFYAPFLQALEALLAYEFSGSEWRVEASCHCSECKELDDYESRYYVPVETLRRLWKSHESIMCLKSFETMSPPKFAPELIFGNLVPLGQNDHAQAEIKCSEIASAFFAFLSEDVFLREAELVLDNGTRWIIREKHEEESDALAGPSPASQQPPSTNSPVETEHSNSVSSDMEVMMNKIVRSHLEPFREEMRFGMSIIRKGIQEVQIGSLNTREAMRRMQGKLDIIEIRTEEIQILLPTLFMALLAERYEARPALFVLLPVNKTLLDKFDVFNTPFELQFLCEHHEGAHFVTKENDPDVKFHRVKQLGEKLRKALCWIRPYFKILHPFLSWALAAAGTAGAPFTFGSESMGFLNMIIQQVGGLIDEAEEQRGLATDTLTDITNAQASNAQHAVDVLLKDEDYPDQAWKYLRRRVLRSTYRTHWICRTHQEDPKSAYVDFTSNKECLKPKPSPSTDVSRPASTLSAEASQKKSKGTLHKLKKELKKWRHADGMP